jgi:hypothetical protein
MLTDLWRQFLALPQWQQAVGTAVVLIAVGLVARTMLSFLTRTSRRTLYVLDESGHSVGHEAPTEESAQGPAAADDESATAAEAPGDADSVDSQTPDWADGKPLCPCCGYPTATDEFNDVCVLCDWSEPESDDSLLGSFRWEVLSTVQPGIGDEERERELRLAKRNFAKYGSALSPEDRQRELGSLNERQVTLRRELRERFDYLKSDPPDISETWDTIDGLITGLREGSP